MVLLDDGREGTVLEIFKEPGNPPDYLIEIGSRGDIVEAPHSKVKKVVWKMPKN
ncbi:MAG: hypothetical protein MJA84_07240 [Firmicutes bacterium]|nr:hypothetical protein [Bacillota bacterium]